MTAGSRILPITPADVAAAAAHISDAVVRAISDAGGNIIELDHVRHRSDVPSRRAMLEVEVELAGATELDRLVRVLRADGFEPKLSG